MKTDLATTIFTGILGIIAAFFICNLLLPKIDDATIKTVNAEAAYSLTDPNPEIFNYRAVNPTVEVYVGQCAEYNANGDCVENVEEITPIEEQAPDTQPDQNEGGQDGTSN